MRGARAFVVLTTYVSLVGAFIFFIYLMFMLNSTGPSNGAQFAGRGVFWTIVGIQAFLVVFMAPAFTAGAISGEKERQTFELLRTTLLSPRQFVVGKMISALSYVFLLIFSSIPLISMAFMLGGVSWVEVVISQLLIFIGAITFALLGLYFSSRMKTTLGATVSSYLTIFIFIIGLPLLALFFGAIFSSISFLFDSDLGEAILIYSGLIASTTNLPATMIISEAFLVTENAIFGFRYSSSLSYWIPSPWPATLLVYALAGWLFFRWTVKRVGKIAE